MSLNKLILAVTICVLAVSADAQRWKKYRSEVTFGVGPTSFLSDVGGYNDEPTNTFTDMNFKSTNWGLFGGYNYYLTKNISVNGQFTYAWLGAKDIHAGNEARRNRNFDIRTMIYEVGVLGRYYFIREKFGHAFRLKGSQNGILYGLSAYVTTGFMGLYFNPTGKHPHSAAGSKYQPLYDVGTEGQTVPGSGVEQYSRVTFAIPLGVGVKYSFDPRWNVGAELMFRKTFSDHLDDVSGVYYDNAAIVAANDGNPEAGYLADPSLRQDSWTGPGERRGGDKNDDFYMTFMLTASYKFLKGKTFKPRF